MFEILLEEKVITICILSFFVISILMQGILSLLYQNMIREAENMATTENKLLKQCKLKFSNCYQLNGGVANIPVFVDKFLNRLVLGRLSFESIYHLSGQLMLLSVVSAGVGVCKSIMNNRSMLEILPFYILCFMELYLYFSITSMLDVKGRKEKLKINLVDYLENHLSSRMVVTEGDMRMLYGEGTSERQREKKRRTLDYVPITNRVGGMADTRNDDSETEAPTESEHSSKIPDDLDQKIAGSIANIFTGAQEKELEALLKEFLTS